MKQMSNNCDSTRIEQFLNQQLSTQENELFEDHLESCVDCRMKLEATAAGTDIWSGVRESLSSGDFQPDLLTDTRSGLEISRASIMRWLAPSDDDRMLGRIGANEIVGIVGTSSMAVVLKAFDPALNRYVAIKLLAPWLHTNGAARKRFSREAQAAAAVVHDNVIEIHCVSVANELPYLVMPFVRGPSLQRRLNEQGPLDVAEILRIGMQAANGLAAAHSQGLVHRDIKPSNILLADGVERVKLTDFGLARAADDASLTRSGIIAGTPQYMSPEQVRGQNVDQRSDLFSLGSVLYAMCIGRPPFRAETSYGVMRQVTDRTPRPIRELNPRIPDWLCGIISKLMSKQPDERFESAGEVADVLEQCLAHIHQPTTVALPDSVAVNSGASFRFRMLAIAMAVLLGVGLFGTFAWIIGGAPDAPDLSSGKIAGSKTPPASENSANPTSTSTASTNNDMATRLHHFKNLTTGNDSTVAISPDGKMVALANGHPTMTMLGGSRVDLKGWKATVQIVDSKTGNEVCSLPLLTDEEQAIVTGENPVWYGQAESIRFSPNGKLVAVGTNIGQVKLFDVTTGELIRTLDDEPARLADEKTPDSWDDLKRALGNVNSIAFSPDGSQLATIGGSFADFAEKFDRVERMGFRATAPGRLKLWDVETGELEHDLEGHNDFAVDAVYSPDGRTLATAGRWSTEHERFGAGVIVWNTMSGAMRNYIRVTADGGVHSIQFTSDSEQILVGTMRFGDGNERTGSVSLHDVSSGQTRWLVTVPGWAAPLQLMPDVDESQKLAVLCGQNSIRFLNVEDGSTEDEIKRDESSQDRAWKDFSMSSDGKFAIASVDQKNIGIEVWTTVEQSVSPPARQSSTHPIQPTDKSTPGRVSFATTAEVGLLSCSRDGQLIAVLNPRDNNGPSVEVYDRNGKLLHVIHPFTAEEIEAFASVEKASLSVRSIAISGESNLLAVGSNFGQVKLFDSETGSLICSLDDEASRLAETRTPESWRELPRVIGSVNSLSFSPDGDRIAICGESFQDFADKLVDAEKMSGSADNGRLKIWDVMASKVALDLSGHLAVSDATFSEDEELLVSAGSWSNGQTDSGVIVWDANSGSQLRTIQVDPSSNHEYSVALSPDKQLIAVHSDRSLTVLNNLKGVVQWRRSILGLENSIAFMANHGSLMALTDKAKLNFFDQNGKTITRIGFANTDKGAKRNVFASAKNGDVLIFGGVDENSKGIVDVWDSSTPAAPDSSEQNPSADADKKKDTGYDNLSEETIRKLLPGKWRLIQQTIDGRVKKGAFNSYVLEFKDDTVLLEYKNKDEFTIQTVGPSRVSLNSDSSPAEMNWIGDGVLVQSVFRFISSDELVIANLGRPEATRPEQIEFDPDNKSGNPHIVWTLVRTNDWWDLESPWLCLPLDYPEAARNRVLGILASDDLQFIKGHNQLRSTNLVYRSETIPLNMLISKLAKCPDFKVHVSFKKAENTHFLHGYDFAVTQHGGETKVNIIININSTNIDFEKLYLPDIVESDK